MHLVWLTSGNDGIQFTNMPLAMKQEMWNKQNQEHNTATETHLKLVFCTLKKIKGFLTLILRNQRLPKKIKSFTLNNAILGLCTLKKN